MFPPQIVYFTLPVSSSPVNGEFDDLEAYSFGIHVLSLIHIYGSVGFVGAFVMLCVHKELPVAGPVDNKKKRGK